MKRLRILRRWFKRKFGYARLVCLALLIGFAALRIADPAPIQELRVRTFDSFQRHRSPCQDRKAGHHRRYRRKEPGAKLGQWPWPRTRIADIVSNLTRLGAVVIAFDVVFAEPDRLNPDIAAETFRNLDEETRDKLRALPSNDQILADAMQQSRVVLGESGLAATSRRTRQDAAGDGTCDAGRGASAFHVRVPRAVAQRPRAGRGGRRARPVHDQCPNATASSGACR